MPLIQISKIKILERQRKEIDPEELAALAESIKRYGLIHPVLLNPDNSLVAGFRRTMAHLLLERTEIEFKYAQDLTELEKKEIELEENIRRANLQPWEEAMAITEIHRMKQDADPSWTQEMTGALFGKKKSTVSNALAITRVMEESPEAAADIKAAETVVGALQRVERAKEIRRRTLEIEARSAGTIPRLQAEVLVGDAAALISEIPSSTFDAIITNPPFGVDLDLGHGALYKDDEDYISHLVRGLCSEWYRTLRPNSWLVSFFDIRKITYNAYLRQAATILQGLVEEYWRARLPEIVLGKLEQTLESLVMASGLAGWLEDAGFTVNILPAIWAKPNKTQGVIRDPNTQFVVSYEALIFARKGNAVLLKQGRQNLFIFDTPATSERVHELQMPTELCSTLVGLVAPGGSLVHDSFAGSASVGMGALDRGCNFLGFELDPERASRGNMRLKEKLLEKQPEEALV